VFSYYLGVSMVFTPLIYKQLIGMMFFRYLLLVATMGDIPGVHGGFNKCLFIPTWGR